MIKRRRPLILLLAGVSVLAAAGFLLAAVSIFLSAASLASANRQHAPTPISVVSPQPLRWSGIESADRTTYAANLRVIGCPESTIAAIILDARFPGPSDASEPSAPNVASVAIQPQSRVFAGSAASNVAAVVPGFSVAGMTGSRAPALSAAVVTTASESVAATPSRTVAAPARYSSSPSSAVAPMARGRGAMVAGALGVPAVAQSQVGNIGGTGPIGESGAIGGAGGTADEQAITAPEGNNIPIPAAFQDPGPSAKLTPAQKKQVDQLQQQFVNDIGGTDQDSSDPEYRARWEAAQRASDERFRLLFGQQALLARQMQENLHKNQ